MAQCQVQKTSHKPCRDESDITYSANGFKDVDLCGVHWEEATADGVNTPDWIEKHSKAKRSKP